MRQRPEALRVTAFQDVDQILQQRVVQTDAVQKDLVDVADLCFDGLRVLLRRLCVLLRCGHPAERLRERGRVEGGVFLLGDDDAAFFGAHAHKGGNPKPGDLRLKLHRAAHLVRLVQRHALGERARPVQHFAEKTDIIL